MGPDAALADCAPSLLDLWPDVWRWCCFLLDMPTERMSDQSMEAIILKMVAFLLDNLSRIPEVGPDMIQIPGYDVRLTQLYLLALRNDSSAPPWRWYIRTMRPLLVHLTGDHWYRMLNVLEDDPSTTAHLLVTSLAPFIGPDNSIDWSQPLHAMFFIVELGLEDSRLLARPLVRSGAYYRTTRALYHALPSTPLTSDIPSDISMPRECVHRWATYIARRIRVDGVHCVAKILKAGVLLVICKATLFIDPEAPTDGGENFEDVLSWIVWSIASFAIYPHILVALNQACVLLSISSMDESCFSKYPLISSSWTFLQQSIATRMRLRDRWQGLSVNSCGNQQVSLQHLIRPPRL
jgi:hypothetical protein